MSAIETWAGRGGVWRWVAILAVVFVMLVGFGAVVGCVMQVLGVGVVLGTGIGFAVGAVLMERSLSAKVKDGRHG